MAQAMRTSSLHLYGCYEGAGSDTGSDGCGDRDGMRIAGGGTDSSGGAEGDNSREDADSTAGSDAMSSRGGETGSGGGGEGGNSGEDDDFTDENDDGKFHFYKLDLLAVTRSPRWFSW
ncbi:unnamed protein product [Pylaiella littoralis]